MFPLPKILYKTTSPLSGEICVVQKGRERQLLVGGFVQSINWDCPGVEKRVWGKIVGEATGLLRLRQPADPRNDNKNILILGLGAGTEAHLLFQAFPKAQITAVEIDPEIIRVVKEFFEVEKIGNLNIVEGSAFDYLKKVKGKCDLIICDIYAGGQYPKEADADWFLSCLAKCARCTIFNRIFDSAKSEAAREFLGRLKYYFEDVKVVEAKHVALNILFVCQ